MKLNIYPLLQHLARRAYQGKTVMDDRPMDMLRDYYLQGSPQLSP